MIHVGQNMSKMFKKAGMSVDPRNIDILLSRVWVLIFATQGVAITDVMKRPCGSKFWITNLGFLLKMFLPLMPNVKKTKLI
jgi:hypothetical protein